MQPIKTSLQPPNSAYGKQKKDYEFTIILAYLGRFYIKRGKKKKKPGVFASCPRWGQKIFLFLLLAKTFIDTSYCHIKINKNNNKRSHAQQLMPKSIWSIWIIHLNGKLNFIVSKDMGNYFTLAT
jgi:hypothetical protein